MAKHVRSTRWIAAGALLVSTSTWAVASGCVFNTAEDCAVNPMACTSNSAVGAGGGGDGGAPPECIPSENGAPVDDGCGVFVSSSGGDEGGDGSKAKPVKSLEAGVEMAEAKGGRVYACAEDHVGSVTLESGVRLYGGLDCKSGWAYVGDKKKSVLLGSVDAVALTITKTAGVAEVVDFEIRAADAVAPGGSSIAVLAEGVTAELVRCVLMAGNGAAGAVGAPGHPTGNSAAEGTVGHAGHNACSNLDETPEPDTVVLGGESVTKDCSGGELSVGGKGGNGEVDSGDDGDHGTKGTGGLGGKGEPGDDMSWTCENSHGKPGSDGMPGTAGVGATGFSSISALGYTGTSGNAGTSGKAGQGGGGGGGAKGGQICSTEDGMVNGSGASGGSGGTGGCGGLPGQGGEPGGASIALVSLRAELITLTDTTLAAGKGGDGGAGGDFQPGGSGGVAGTGGFGAGGSKPGCDGGKGGIGGNGGPGGGGLGGPSLGIAFKGTPPQSLGKTMVTPGTSGAGGPGGHANYKNNAGAPGIAAEQQEFL